VTAGDRRTRGGGSSRPVHQYDIIAKLWMEQVDAKAIHKSSTMFLSVLPPGEFRTLLTVLRIRVSWKVKVKGQGHQGQKRHFLALSAICCDFCSVKHL